MWTRAVAVLITLSALGAETVNQGAPGKQGPWGVYCLSTASIVLSKGSAPYNYTPAAVNASSTRDDSKVLAASAVGMSCALGTPVTLNASIGASCIAGAGTVTIRFNNPTLGSLSPGAGVYTVVLF